MSRPRAAHCGPRAAHSARALRARTPRRRPRSSRPADAPPHPADPELSSVRQRNLRRAARPRPVRLSGGSQARSVDWDATNCASAVGAVAVRHVSSTGTRRMTLWTRRCRIVPDRHPKARIRTDPRSRRGRGRLNSRSGRHPRPRAGRRTPPAPRLSRGPWPAARTRRGVPSRSDWPSPGPRASRLPATSRSCASH